MSCWNSASDLTKTWSFHWDEPVNLQEFQLQNTPAPAQPVQITEHLDLEGTSEVPLWRSSYQPTLCSRARHPELVSKGSGQMAMQYLQGWKYLLMRYWLKQYEICDPSQRNKPLLVQRPAGCCYRCHLRCLSHFKYLHGEDGGVSQTFSHWGTFLRSCLPEWYEEGKYCPTTAFSL